MVLDERSTVQQITDEDIVCFEGWVPWKILRIPSRYPISMYSQHLFWVNYNDLTATSLEIMASKGNHPQMALIHVSEIL
jgi:hypothetical protein